MCVFFKLVQSFQYVELKFRWPDYGLLLLNHSFDIEENKSKPVNHIYFTGQRTQRVGKGANWGQLTFPQILATPEVELCFSKSHMYVETSSSHLRIFIGSSLLTIFLDKVASTSRLV